MIVAASSCESSPSNHPNPTSRKAIAQNDDAASLPLPANRESRRNSVAATNTTPKKRTSQGDSIRVSSKTPKKTVCRAMVRRKKISTFQAIDSAGRDSG